MNDRYRVGDVHPSEHATNLTVKPRYYLEWAEVKSRVARIARKHPPGAKCYGVPRGGMCASIVWPGPIVHDPRDADVILDDIIDSGATRDRYRAEFPLTPFEALVDRASDTPGWYVFPWESESGPEDAVVRLLEFVGEDPKREGLRETPRRVVRAWEELTAGYREDPAAILSKQFEEACDEMIVVRDIAFTSMCEHHLMPFHGTVTAGYLPQKTIVGLSKIPRLVRAYASRLQVQERMTNQIAQALAANLDPLGVGVIVRGHHTCMSNRGVRAHGEMVTSALLGRFRDEAVRREFLGLAS